MSTDRIKEQRERARVRLGFGLRALVKAVHVAEGKLKRGETSIVNELDALQWHSAAARKDATKLNELTH